MKTIITAVVLMTAIAVGTVSAFKYGFIDKAKDEASGLVNKALGQEEATASPVAADSLQGGPAPSGFVPSMPGGTPAEIAAIPHPVSGQSAAVPPPAARAATPSSSSIPPSLRPPGTQATPAGTAASASPSNGGGGTRQQGTGSFVPAAVSVAQAALSDGIPETSPAATGASSASQVRPAPSGSTAGSGLRPGTTLSVADVSAPEPARRSAAHSVSSAQAQMQALGQQRAAQAAQSTAPAQSGATVREDISAMTGPGRAATPVLSEARAQIKVIDQLLGSNPAEALRRIEELEGMRLEPDDAAEAGYRRGYVARLLRDEAGAEKAWKETVEKYPSLRGGRFSALALGDTWYHLYAGVRPQMSYWDDIQLMYSRAIGSDDAPFLPEHVKTQLKQKLNRLNDSLFFGSAPSKLARYHKVEPGELLSTIANKYRVDYESIARINGIDPNRIRAGMDLKLVVGDVEVVVRKNSSQPDRQPTVTWYLDGRWVREYPACVGPGDKTPAGTYTFTSKERDPSWTNPVNGQLLSNDHPDNILGSRWMAMKGMNTQGLGIHGTTVDDSIPGYTSAGCVRLLNRDVEDLFSFARIGGKVRVIE